MPEKSCDNCEHEKVSVYDNPCKLCCRSCLTLWELKEPTDVMITVVGGCVEVEHKPPGLKVFVRDYDTDGSIEVDATEVKEDEYGTYKLYEW